MSQDKNEPSEGAENQRPELADDVVKRLCNIAQVDLAELNHPNWSDKDSLLYHVEGDLQRLWDRLSVESKLVAYIEANRVATIYEDAREHAWELDTLD